MKLRTPSIHQKIKFVFWLLALGLLGWLFYWLLPVAIQSRLSADHVRHVFGASDADPVAGSSLSSLWTALLFLLRETGLGVGGETFATAAALSGWLTIVSLAILAFVVPAPAMILLALTPAVLWCAVVPNGTSVQFFVLALMAVLSNPGVSFNDQRKRWVLGAVIDGLGCALTPAAWLLVVLRALRVRQDRTTLIIRVRLVFFAVGFSLPLAIASMLGGDAYARLPVLSAFRAMRVEDRIGAAAVFFRGGGEISIAMAASLAFAIAIALGSAWRPVGAAGAFKRISLNAKWAFLILPFLLILTLGHPKSWRLAHPGWNTVIEDFALNVDRSFSDGAVAVVRTSTEEAAIRYADAILAKKPHVSALRPVNLFEPSTLARVQSREPNFRVEEARVNVDGKVGPSAAGSKPLEGFSAFVEYLIVPNVQRGVQFWLDAVPDRNSGLEIRFLGNGLGVRSTTGSTKFVTGREDLKSSHVRSHVGFREYEAGPTIEQEIFARYAVYHLAVARIIAFEKRTPDWEQRARAEHYAALRKVEWLKESYQKVCVEPGEKAAVEGKKDSAPLDICIETQDFHEKE
ncbi:hypothetical protein BH10BDE1_BH10BDE1_19440 [soil metagenome]